MVKLFVATFVVLISLQTQASFFSRLFRSVVQVVVRLPVVGNMVDSGLDRYAHRRLESKINPLIQSARSCKPRETDQNLDVDYWITQRPGYPGWAELESLDRNKASFQERSRQFPGTDKAQHCYGGCLISKEVSYSAAVLTGWMKELQDASDCQPQLSRFELQDQDATVGGALAAQHLSCESFCSRFANSTSGVEILRAAQALASTATGASRRAAASRAQSY